jgi:hypothetical protein
MGYIVLGGRSIPTQTYAERLNLATAGSATAAGVAAVWTPVWTYQVPQGNAISFKARNLPRYATTWVLLDAATTAMPAATLVRLVQMAPDNLTMKKILLSSDYATLVGASGVLNTTMVTVNSSCLIPPGDILRIEVFHATATFLVAGSAVSLGATRHSFNQL